MHVNFVFIEAAFIGIGKINKGLESIDEIGRSIVEVEKDAIEVEAERNGKEIVVYAGIVVFFDDIIIQSLMLSWRKFIDTITKLYLGSHNRVKQMCR
jgi:hypothetical protein